MFGGTCIICVRMLCCMGIHTGVGCGPAGVCVHCVWNLPEGMVLYVRTGGMRDSRLMLCDNWFCRT